MDFGISTLIDRYGAGWFHWWVPMVVVLLLLLVVLEESVSVLILAPQSLLTVAIVAIVGFVDLLGETNSEEEMTTHLDIDIDIAAATVTATTAATLEAHGNIILQTLV